MWKDNTECDMLAIIGSMMGVIGWCCVWYDNGECYREMSVIGERWVWWNTDKCDTIIVSVTE